MATKKQQEDFIAAIGPIMIKYAKQYGYKCVSGAIAQACLESGYGLSTLAARYHNYYGLKCGANWKGPSVNLRTMEEYTKGTLTAIQANFRVYSNMDEGVKGYYEFLNKSRYVKVKDQAKPEDYLTAIKNAGYATSTKYVQNNMNRVVAHNLIAWDVLLNLTNLTDLVHMQIPEIKTSEVIAPVYKVGGTYTLNVEMNVRTGAGKWNRRLGYEELTHNAQINDRDKNGALDKGTRVTCREVRKDGEDIWIRIPSGWVAAYYQGRKNIA